MLLSMNDIYNTLTYNLLLSRESFCVCCISAGFSYEDVMNEANYWMIKGEIKPEQVDAIQCLAFQALDFNK